jgi:hypothetical protein
MQDTVVDFYTADLQLALNAYFWRCVTDVSFPGRKARPERDADHSPSSSAEVKKE